MSTDSSNPLFSLYGSPPKQIEPHIVDLCSQIKLVVFDVDGVFSDGSIYLGNHGEEYKAFNTKDGYGVKALSKIGIDVAVITGRNSHIVATRMQSLQVKHLVQGREDKQTALQDLMQETGYTIEQVASMGDDMPDLGMFALSAIKVATADAHPMVTQKANFVTELGGGKGAVREFCDLLLMVNGAINTQHGASV